jgi:RNA polymerase sigma factor (sigma-70 family)
VVTTGTVSERDLVALADARLEREYGDRYRRLMSWARRFDWLSAEDREEVVDDVLIAWHGQLCAGKVEFEDTFCGTVLRREAISRLRRRLWVRAHIVELAAGENVGVDPHLDSRVTDREEARRFWTLAGRVLSDQELRVLWLRACGYQRSEISELVGVSGQDVRVALQRARRKVCATLDHDHDQDSRSG